MRAGRMLEHINYTAGENDVYNEESRLFTVPLFFALKSSPSGVSTIDRDGLMISAQKIEGL